jgi:Mg-chelatase subunit ChlD
MFMRYQFKTYDFLGGIKASYLVEEESVTTTAQVVAKSPGHFVFIADASGSMWGQMADLRMMIVKLLTLEEFRDESVLVTVLSFSSEGDLVRHAVRTPISEFMSPGSVALEQVTRLSARGLTCISQSLKALPGLIQNETTAVVLLSDGYANDSSPGSERRQIDNLVVGLSKLPNVMMHTISLGHYADFKLLSYIANACSGTCFQTPTVKEVYTVLHDTTALLAGQSVPALDLPVGTFDYQVFVSKSARKVVGSSSDLLVRGLAPEDDAVVYRFRRQAADTSLPDAPEHVALAFSKAQLAEGNLNVAKYALMATRDLDLINKHAAALVNADVAAMASDLEGALFTPASNSNKTDKYGIPNAHVPSTLSILSTLSQYASDVEVNVTELRKHYKRRGVKRVEGTREADGSITTPWVKTAYKDNGDWSSVSSFDINQNAATVNMLVRRPVNLVDTSTGQTIDTVAGISLNLKSYNNYTLVGDGELTVPSLEVRFSNKRAFREMIKLGVLPDGDFDPSKAYTLSLSDRPLVSYDMAFNASALRDGFTAILQLRTLQSILNALTKGTSDSYTDEQIAELKRHYLSTSLYFSPPTTTEYADLKQALADGVIDTRVSYKVDIGSTTILNAAELYSANEYMARRFTVKQNGTEEKKPKYDMLWNKPEVTLKTLSARTKLNPVVGILASFVGYNAGQTTTFYNAIQGKLTKDATVEVYSDAAKDISVALDRLQREILSPLVFYVGATGVVPDDFNAVRLDAEGMAAKYPDLSLGKKVQDATFYVFGDTVITVYADSEYFSTGKVA